jgi:hypothetical protein
MSCFELGQQGSDEIGGKHLDIVLVFLQQTAYKLDRATTSAGRAKKA